MNGEERTSYRGVMLMVYDTVILLLACALVLLPFFDKITEAEIKNIIIYAVLTVGCVTISRYTGRIYRQVWRYSRVGSYLRLLFADAIGFAVNAALIFAYAVVSQKMSLYPILLSLLAIIIGLMGSIAMRFAYVWIYERVVQGKLNGKYKKLIERIFSLTFEERRAVPDGSKIRIAIVGAGRVGTALAEQLINNPAAIYTPVCFVDVDQRKVGRDVMNIRVLSESESTKMELSRLCVQEIVFAVTGDHAKQEQLYNYYKQMGLKIKSYSYMVEDTAQIGKRQIREFAIEELLFRKKNDFFSETTSRFYKDKVVMITGGGGSIGSELARQIARMQPKQLIIVDIYENNAYDIQQELALNYKERLDVVVEIASVRDRAQIDKVMRTYHPEIVLHAAAHKHVPLMEHNCSEAVKNNVFGMLNVVDMAEKYGVKKFIMISTDKAVNPTNVMGASKRLCEMIVLSRAADSKTSFSCTRFGNVLGSNGSVVPLFKRQIANGGPVTVTDKRIIRYLMTIPEASQLVLTSGAMAKSGELFVLDMGRPVKILDLAENMIRLSGLEPYKDIDIVETGLRPGEKLFEELLIKTEVLTKTDNDMIFIEKDVPVSREEIASKLKVLSEALATEDDDAIRQAMKKVVPTFHSAKHVNRDALADGRYKQEADGSGNAIA